MKAAQDQYGRRGMVLWRHVLKLTAGASVIVLLSMMLLTSADVIARYVFNRPISGAFELTEVLLAVLVFLAMPMTTASDGHIRVDLLPFRTGSRITTVFTVLSVALVAVVFLFMAWEVLEHAIKLEKRNTVTNSLSIPLYPIAGLVALACAASALAAVLSFFGDRKG